MLVVSMDPEYGEKAQIPQPDQKATPAQSEARTIVIEVLQTAEDQTPSVRINQENVPWQELGNRLARII